MAHLTENQVFNLVSGSAAAGQSTYDMWKSIEGNENKSVQDFLNYLKDDGESNVSEETLAQIEKNKNDISQLTKEIDDLNENLVNQGLIPKPTDNANLVPNAISSNGAIYNGCGYINGYRLNSSGNIVEMRQACLTGFMPFSGGSKLSIYGSKGSIGIAGLYVATYNNKFEFIGVAEMSTLSGLVVTADENNIFTFEIDATETMFTNASHIRVSLNPCEGKDMIIKGVN